MFLGERTEFSHQLHCLHVVSRTTEVVPEEAMLRAYHLFQQHLSKVEYLTEFEGTVFVPSGPAAQGLLDITAVHPMREEAVRAFLNRAGMKWAVVQELLKHGQLVQSEYQGRRCYLRRFSPQIT